MKLKRIPSFTLSELIVVMVLTGILVTAAFFALNSIQKQVGLLQKAFQLEQDVYLLEREFIHEAGKANMVYDSINKQLRFYSSNRLNKQYSFKKSMLIRDKDSLTIPITKVYVYEKGVRKAQGSIDAFELVFKGVYTSRKLFIATRKDAAYYMNKQ